MAPPINLEKIVEKLSVDYIVKKKADSILEYLQKTIASTSGDDFDFSDNLSSRLAIQKRMLSITGRDCRLVICELSSVCYSTDFLKHIRKDVCFKRIYIYISSTPFLLFF